MTKRNKLGKFSEILTFPNVYENFRPQDEYLTHMEGVEVRRKGLWRKEHFKNDNPIVLELACGRGEYTNALAQAFPEKNFIGVDIKGARIWKGARYALLQKLTNVAYLRTRIEHIDNFFEPNEVDEIWITFPDPHLRESKENKRLTSHRFMSIYRNFLKKGGYVHLKTDDDTLYHFTLDTVKEQDYIELDFENGDIYDKHLNIPELDYKTYYEVRHLAIGRTIKYVRMKLN